MTPETDAVGAEGSPIPEGVVAAVADARGIDADELAAALAEVHADLVDGADAIRGHYRSEGGPPALATPDGLAEVIFVAPEQWAATPTELADPVRSAARAAHAAHARELGADEALLEEYAPLVMPSETVGTLVRAGLSRRQAEVQVLRDRGLDNAAIADRLGIATNTAKVHAHRVDAKVENARRLLAVVGG
jgi:DNA-binding CsgD family transcriptional regulator